MMHRKTLHKTNHRQMTINRLADEIIQLTVHLKELRNLMDEKFIDDFLNADFAEYELEDIQARVDGEMEDIILKLQDKIKIRHRLYCGMKR